MQQDITTRRTIGRRVCLLERESDLMTAEAAIASQDHALRKVARLRQDQIVRVVRAAGYSGSLPPGERPDIEEILDAAERDEFDYVLATEIARVNRGEAYGYYYLKHELGRLGKGLEFLDQAFEDDGESEIGALMEGLSVLLPSIDKRSILRRFRRGKDRVRDEGFQWSGIAPFGYEYIKGGQHGHEWRIVRDEAEWIIKIFAWASQGVPRNDIARRLNDTGVPTRRPGARWWGSTISGIIANPRYKGEWPEQRYTTRKAARAYKARPFAAGNKYHPTKRRGVRTSKTKLRPTEWGKIWLRPELAVVSPELWAAANAMAPLNQQTAARRARQGHLLTGLVRCDFEHDGKGSMAMTYDQRKGHGDRYRCSYHDGPSGCACRRSVLAAEIEAGTWELVCDLALAPERLIRTMLAGFEQQRARLQRLVQVGAAARAQVSKYETALANLDVQRACGEMDHDRYERAVAIVKAKLAEAHKALEGAGDAAGPGALAGPNAALVDALLARTAGADPDAGAAAELVRQTVADVLGQPTRAELEALSLEEKRRRLRQVIEGIYVGPEGMYAKLVLGHGKVAIGNGTCRASVHNTLPPAIVFLRRTQDAQQAL